MLKKLMLTTAIGALMIGGAVAQTTSPSSSPSASAQSGTTGSVTQQKPDQYLASKFRGTDVISPDNQKIGDVTDILFDKNGKIEAYIVSVGGFLGIGAKDVALEPSKFQVVAAEGNTQLRAPEAVDDQGPAATDGELRALSPAGPASDHRHRRTWRTGRSLAARDRLRQLGPL